MQQQQLYSTNDVARLSGATLRMLQLWSESKIAPETKFESGQRRYSDLAALRVLIACRLREKGVSLQRVKRLVRSFDKAKAPSVVLLDGGPLFLLTDFATLHLTQRMGRVIELMTSSRCPMILVDVGEEIQLMKRTVM